jgi:hypothetical protein
MYHCSSIKIKPSFTSTLTVPHHYYNTRNTSRLERGKTGNLSPPPLTDGALQELVLGAKQKLPLGKQKWPLRIEERERQQPDGGFPCSRSESGWYLLHLELHPEMATAASETERKAPLFTASVVCTEY